MKNKKTTIILVVSILLVIGIILVFLFFGLNNDLSNLDNIVKESLEKKYNIKNYKLISVKKSPFISKNFYKVILNDGFEFDVYTDKECTTCKWIFPFGKYETVVNDNYIEKYNASVISKYFDNKKIKYKIIDFPKSSDIKTYNFDIEISSSYIDNFLYDLIKLDTESSGLLKINDKYTTSYLMIKCGNKRAYVHVGDPNDDQDKIYFKEELSKLR